MLALMRQASGEHAYFLIHAQGAFFVAGDDTAPRHQANTKQAMVADTWTALAISRYR